MLVNSVLIVSQAAAQPQHTSLNLSIRLIVSQPAGGCATFLMYCRHVLHSHFSFLESPIDSQGGMRPSPSRRLQPLQQSCNRCNRAATHLTCMHALAISELQQSCNSCNRAATHLTRMRLLREDELLACFTRLLACFTRC